MATNNVYGNGTTTASAGANTITHFYDKAGIKAANRVSRYGQFADRKHMPQKMGKNFKISKFLHLYDRALNDSEFATKGFLSARSIAELNAGINSATLNEGDGAKNKKTLQKVTMSTEFARYGEMLDYTDEVELFSEDAMQVRYREELGELANSRQEDLIQRDMLSTTTVLRAGSAMADDELDEDSKISYDVIRKGVRLLVRNRAKKNTSIVTGDVKVDTRTIAQSYYAIIGANVKGDLETEVGAMHEVRFIEAEGAAHYAGVGAEATSANVGELSYTGTLGTDAKFDVFPILFPTAGSFATVGLKGKGKINFNSRSPKFVTNENPYATTGFFSYNFFYAGIILEEEKLLKILVTASA